MKNKLLIFLLLLISIYNSSYAEEFKFETSQIELFDNGKLIKAINGKAFSVDQNIEVEASKFEYKKDLNILKAYDGIANIKSDDIQIKFKEIKIDQNQSLISTINKTKIIDFKRNVVLRTQNVSYDKKNKILESDYKSILEDGSNNKISMESFKYNINNDILKINGLNLLDFKKNIYKTQIAYINTKTKKLFGKDIEINLNNETFNENNEPRLKGRSVIDNQNFTEITKGVFTTCKKNDTCPPWELSAKKIKHDKKKKSIDYKNAWLKVYDVPIFYFPKFFHPDPTVKRKSGFLIPTLTNSTSGDFLSLPYFKVVSQNKDLTFTPRFYTSDKFLLQTEYRQVTKTSKSLADFSISGEKNKSTKNHFFYNLDKNFNFNYFEDTNLKLKVEKTSNDTYLRSNNLKSEIIKDQSVLENSLVLDLYSEDISVDADITIYENLDKDKTDRYEFILPRINFTQKLENKTKLNGEFEFKSSNLIKNYDTNIFEKTNINDLIFKSSPKISKFGFYNNYEFILKNSNSDAQNSANYQEDKDHYVGGLIQYNSSLPMVKETQNFQNLLKPRVTLKLSPNHTKDKRDSFTRLDVNNIYGLNRLASSDSLEGGISITYGNEFQRINKKNSREDLVLKIANNTRFQENPDLPRNNQMNQKTSNLFGEISYSPTEFFTTKYNFSKKNDFDELTYESISTQFNLNNFVTSFDYINQNDTQDKISYLQSEFKYNFNQSNNISFSSRQNKEKDLTEYYNLMYQYKNDCLAASIEYNKNYYDDRDIKPEENIFLKLTIMPFGQIASSPNLKE